jgi:hypothetical protein
MKAFVIFRDRLSYALECIEALYRANLEVHIIDQGSTYPKAALWLRQQPATVHYLPNQHPQRLWNTGIIDQVVGRDKPYIVTDCDVVSVAPADWVAELEVLLYRNPDRNKVGLGLETEDIPDHYLHRRKVIEWEAQHWANPIDQETFAREHLYGAAVDTTLAMYQPLKMYPSFSLGPAIRTGFPYVAKHLSWYEDSANPSEEQIYYEAHMNRDFSHWIAPERYA